MSRPKSPNSLPAKLATLKANESIVLYAEDPGKLMRMIETLRHRGYCDQQITCRKARVVIGDELRLGVEVTLGDANEPE